MYYIYVIRSLKDKGFYVGKTQNIRQRIKEHNKGRIPSTKDRKPFKFIYCEASNDPRDTDHREKYLKTAWGKRYLNHRLKHDNA